MSALFQVLWWNSRIGSPQNQVLLHVCSLQVAEAADSLCSEFRGVDNLVACNSARVLKAFQNTRVGSHVSCTFYSALAFMLLMCSLQLRIHILLKSVIRTIFEASCGIVDIYLCICMVCCLSLQDIVQSFILLVMKKAGCFCQCTYLVTSTLQGALAMVMMKLGDEKHLTKHLRKLLGLSQQ